MKTITTYARNLTSTEFTRFFWAGSLAFASDFTVLLLLTEVAQLNYLWSNLAGVTVGIVVSYLLSIKWVFLNRKYTQVSLEFPLFVITSMLGLMFNELLMWVTVEYGQIHYLIAKILVTLLIFVFNFYIKKIFLFNTMSR